LCAIIGNASYASEHIDNHSATAEALDKINRIAANANDIALGLLTFSRQSDTAYEYCNVTDIIDSVLAIVRKELEYRRVELITNYQTTAPIRIVPGKLQQVLLNLIQNSLDAIEEKQGRLEIAVKQGSGFLEIHLSDNGHGIEPSIIEKIFDPFFSTKGVWGRETQGGGTGLGLSVCRNIIREHDGDLLVESQAGKGSKFTIRLPYQDEPTSHDIPVPDADSDRHAKVYCRDDISYGLLKEHLSQAGWKVIRIKSRAEATAEPQAKVAFLDTGGAGKIRFAKIYKILRDTESDIKLYLLTEGQREYLMDEYHKNAAGIIPWSSIIREDNEIPQCSSRMEVGE
jgi:hypothetical protein